MMKSLFTLLHVAVFGICFAREAQIPSQGIIVKLPDPIEKLLLQKTGTKSVFSVRELAYRQCEKFEILAAVVELENHADVEGDIVEGVMHVRVVFVSQRDGAVKMYGTDEELQTVVNVKEVDMKRFLKPFE